MYDVTGVDMPCMDLNVNVEHFPQVGGGELVKQLSWQGGNKVASGMIACARLGAKCAMMGCVGDDIFGRVIINDFERHGINADAMKMRESSTTSLCIVLSDSETGNRTFIFKPGSSPRYTIEDMDSDLIRSGKYFFISVINDDVIKAVKSAREAGVKIFIDADSYSEEAKMLIPQIDIFVGSEDFYNAMFTSGDYETNCKTIMDMGSQIVIFTLGDKGCVGMSAEGFFKLPAFSVKAVDTVGAGDVFHGAFLAGLLRNLNAEEAARFASAASAIKCTRIGGRAGIPDIPTIERFLQDGFIDYTEIDERVNYYERGLEHI